MSADKLSGIGGEDERLEQLFRTLNPSRSADEFTSTVMRRITRRARMRRFVLGSASAIGLLLCAAAISQGITVQWQHLVEAADWRALLEADASTALLWLLFLAAPVAARYLAR